MRALKGLRALFVCSAALLAACISVDRVDETGQLGRVEIRRIILDSGRSRLEGTISPDDCWTFPGVGGGLRLSPIWTFSTLNIELSQCSPPNRIVINSLSLSATSVQFPAISLGQGARRFRAEFPLELDDSLQFLCSMDAPMKLGTDVTISMQVTMDEKDPYLLVAEGTARPFR